MRVADVAKLPLLERFLYWVQERESIRLRRLAGQSKPWTDDEILQRYRFCNVRRMDDKVSQWLLKNWYEPNYNHSNMIIACCLARFFNLPSSLEAIGFPFKWDAKRTSRVLRRLQHQGRCIFNGAYMVRGNDGVDKVGCVINDTIQAIARKPPVINPSSMRRTWEVLLPYRGMASFMAGQVVSDLRWAMHGTWGDRHEWAPLGPGSRRGMNRWLQRDIRDPMEQKEFNELLGSLILHCRKEIPSRALVAKMEAMDWQNCLCEFDKYSRVLLGEGRPKQLYPGA